MSAREKHIVRLYGKISSLSGNHTSVSIANSLFDFKLKRTHFLEALKLQLCRLGALHGLKVNLDFVLLRPGYLDSGFGASGANFEDFDRASTAEIEAYTCVPSTNTSFGPETMGIEIISQFLDALLLLLEA